MAPIPPTRSEEKKGGQWFTLHNAIMDDPAYLKLKLVELRLLDALLKYADGDGRCWPSLKTLARYVIPSYKESDPAPSDLCAALKSLEAKGFITKESGGGTRSTRYTVLVPSGTGETRRRGTGVTHRASTGETRRRGTGVTHRTNSHSTPSVTATRTRRGGDSPSERVSKEDQRVIKAFRDLGVKSKPLIKATLRKKGRDWMDAFLMLITVMDARDEIGNVAAFAVWGLTTKKKVDLDTSPKPTAGEVREYDAALNGNGHQKKKRKKYRQPVEVMKKSVDGRRYGWDCDPLAGQREGERWD